MSLTSQQIIKATPWRDVQEFNDTLSNLMTAADLFQTSPVKECDDDYLSEVNGRTGDDVDLGLKNVYRAIQVVAVWRVRDSGSLPHAVDCMGSLAEMLLRDFYMNVYIHKCKNLNDSITGNSDDIPFQAIGVMELRLAYSAALIRGVNGLTDSILQSQQSLSVHTLALKLNLPNWLVDMRHDAAHNALGTLPSLRAGAITLLKWLGDRYWLPMFHSREIQYSKAMEVLNHKYIIHANDEKWKECNKDAMYFIKSCISTSVDVGHRVLLDFLIYGEQGSSVAISGCNSYQVCGALVSKNTLTEVSEKQAQACRRKLIPLLRNVLKHWPGFLHSLVVSLVFRVLELDSLVLRNDQKLPIADKQLNHQMMFLLSWLEYILTDSKMLTELYPTFVHASKERKSIHFKFLRRHLPLVCLYNCCEREYNDKGGIASQKIMEMITNACPSISSRLNIQDNVNLDSSPFSIEQNITEAEVSKNGTEQDDDPMSLEDMERLLTSSDEESLGHQNTDSECNMNSQEASQNKQLHHRYLGSLASGEEIKPWTICEVWETCPLGQMPCEVNR